MLDVSTTIFFFPHPIFLGQPLFLLAALSPGCSQCSELHLHWTYPSQLSCPTLRSAGTQFPPISPISHLLKGVLFAAVSAPGPCEFKASDPFKQRIRATSVFSSRSEVVLILCLESLSNISESCTNGLELHSWTLQDPAAVSGCLEMITKKKLFLLQRDITYSTTLGLGYSSAISEQKPLIFWWK